VRDRLVQQGADMSVVQRVDHLAPVALADDETEVAQHPQLLGDGRLSHPDLARELSDRAGASTKARACIVSATELAVSVDRNARSGSAP